MTDSIPIKDVLLCVKRHPDMPELTFLAMCADDLTPAQFADLIAYLIHHAAEKFVLPPSEVFDMVRHMHAGEHNRARGGKVVFHDFKRGK